MNHGVERLGMLRHSRIQTTLEQYAQQFPTGLVEAQNRFLCGSYKRVTCGSGPWKMNFRRRPQRPVFQQPKNGGRYRIRT
jgi:hypothetical protein